MLQEECMSITIALALAAVTSVGPAAPHDGTGRWRVEIRDVDSTRNVRDIDPRSGTLVAKVDLDQNGTSMHAGEDVPYVDVQSMEMITDEDGRLQSSDPRMLRTGIEVSIDGTAEAPVLHAKDVSLIGESQHMVMGTMITMPRTRETGMSMTIAKTSNRVMVGGYYNRSSKPSTVRYYFVSRI